LFPFWKQLPPDGKTYKTRFYNLDGTRILGLAAERPKLTTSLGLSEDDQAAVIDAR